MDRRTSSGEEADPDHGRAGTRAGEDARPRARDERHRSPVTSGEPGDALLMPLDVVVTAFPGIVRLVEASGDIAHERDHPVGVAPRDAHLSERVGKVRAGHRVVDVVLAPVPIELVQVALMGRVDQGSDDLRRVGPAEDRVRELLAAAVHEARERRLLAIPALVHRLVGRQAP